MMSNCEEPHDRIADPAAPSGDAADAFSSPGAGDIPLARPIAGAAGAMVLRRRDPILLPGTGRGAAVLDIGVAVIALIGLESLFGAVFHTWLSSQGHLPPEAPGAEGTGGLQQQWLVPGLVARTVFVCLVLGLILLQRRQPLASVGITRRRWGLDLGIGVLGLAITYGLIALVALFASLVWPEVTRQLNENAERLMEIVPALGPLGFLGIAVLIGIHEELLFRGFIMTRLRRATGSWTAAVLVSSVLFTAPHAFDQTVGALVIVGVLSLVFSLLTVWRRSILPAIVTHTLFDYSQFLMLSNMLPAE